MNYILKTKPLNNNDSSKQCPHPELNHENYEIYLNALITDISSIPSTSIKLTTDNEIHIESLLPKEEILSILKPFFSENFCHIRYVEIIPSNEIPSK